MESWENWTPELAYKFIHLARKRSHYILKIEKVIFSAISRLEH